MDLRFDDRVWESQWEPEASAPVGLTESQPPSTRSITSNPVSPTRFNQKQRGTGSPTPRWDLFSTWLASLGFDERNLQILDLSARIYKIEPTASPRLTPSGHYGSRTDRTSGETHVPRSDRADSLIRAGTAACAAAISVMSRDRCSTSPLSGTEYPSPR